MATICKLNENLRYYLCLEPMDMRNAEKWLAYTLKHIGSTKPEDMHLLLPEEWSE